jgi:hypothetical protein
MELASVSLFDVGRGNGHGDPPCLIAAAVLG